jgi:release factor glutamine methyltransferase
MTARRALARATVYFAERGIESPSVDAEWLLSHALGVPRSTLALVDELPTAGQARFRELVERRAAREPLAYVLGEWGFRRLTLKLDSRALVPRPETEVTVERCLMLLEGLRGPRVLDVGTGTGAIALALADEHPGAHVTALDRSADALALAREKIQTTGLAGRVTVLEADLSGGLPGGPYDLVVSNPPYVLGEELAGLAPEVTSWEPREAILDSGQTESIARSARYVLVSGGRLVLETHGEGAQRTAVLLRDLGYEDVTVTLDLSGRERVADGQCH